MLNVILGILMVSLVSASGLMLIEHMSLSAAIADQRENARRLDLAADATAAKLGTPAGANQATLYAPAPKAGQGAFSYAQLPDAIAGVHATVAGIPFRYCPYAPDEGDLTVSGGYVIKGPRAAGQIASLQPAGVIIAAGLKGAQPPECASVVYADGRITVPGGLVRVISGVNGVSDAQLTDGNSFEIWSAPGAAGSGADAAHPASMLTAIELWKGRLPKSMVIHVPAGAVFDEEGISAAFSVGSQPSGTIRSSKLSIVAYGSGARPVIMANSTFDPQGSIALVNVNMPQTVIRLGSHNAAALQDASVAGVDVAAGSSVAFNGGVTVQGGGVTIAGDATAQGTLAVAGSSSGDLIAIPGGGRLVMNGAAIVLSNGTSGIALGGDLAGTGTISAVNAGVREAVRLVDGGRLNISQGSVGGVISGYTILSDGAPASLAGILSVSAGGAGECWNRNEGSIFAFSQPNLSSVTIQPTEPTPPPADANGTVSAADMQSYAVSSSLFTRQMAARAAALAANRSAWSCST